MHSEQLDLFADGRLAGVERDLAVALCEHRFHAAAQSLKRLQAKRPGYTRVGPYAVLLDEGQRFQQEWYGAERALACLESTLVPAAAVLGEGRAARFLAPLWQGLARRLHDHPFDAARPKLHASYAYARIGEWAAVRASVEQVPGWRCQPDLLARQLDAAARLGAAQATTESLCRLCWDFPHHAERYLCAAGPLQNFFWRFVDIDVDLAVTEFPAWYALTQAVSLCVPPDVRNRKAQQVAALVNRLIAEPTGAPAIDARRQLSLLHRGLFAIFMALVRGNG